MAGNERPIRVAVADDEPLARATLRGLLEADPEVELVSECANGAEILRAVRELAPDLLLLDVQMPGLGGFEVLEALGEAAPPLVVFITAYDRYALRAFEVHAVDYLLKPFDDDRFREALTRAKERLRTRAAVDMGRQLAELLATVTAGEPGPPGGPTYSRRLSIHREGRVELVDVGSILWIEAADQYVRLHTDQGPVLMRESMGKLEQSLDPALFLRVHRSAIAAVSRVRALETAGGPARLLLEDGSRLPVSRSRVTAVRERLG